MSCVDFEEFISKLDATAREALANEKLETMEDLSLVPRDELRQLGLRLGDLNKIEQWKRQQAALANDKQAAQANSEKLKPPMPINTTEDPEYHPAPGRSGTVTPPTVPVSAQGSMLFTADSPGSATVSPSILDEMAQAERERAKKGLSVKSAEYRPLSSNNFSLAQHNSKSWGEHHNSHFGSSNSNSTANAGTGFHNPAAQPFTPMLAGTSAFAPGSGPLLRTGPLAPHSGMMMVQESGAEQFQPYHTALLNTPGLLLVDSKQYGEPMLLPRHMRHRHDNTMTVVTICQLAPASNPFNVVAMIQALFQITISVIHETEACFSVTGVPQETGPLLQAAYPGVWTHVHRDGEERWCVQLDETLSKMTPADFQARLAQHGVQVASHNLHKRHRIIRITVPVEDANRLCQRSRSLLQDKDGCFFVAFDYQANNVLQQYARWLSEPTRRDGLRDALLPCNPVVFELLHRFSGK